MPLDEAATAGGTWALSLAGIGDGLRIESFSFDSSGKAAGRAKVREVSITRLTDGHSPTIAQVATGGKPIASAEIKGRGRAGTTTFKMQNVVVPSYTVDSSGTTETFTLDFDDFSAETK